MPEATQTEVTVVLCASSENPLLASSTCLFASNGGRWALELASVWAEGGRSRGTWRRGGSAEVPTGPGASAHQVVAVTFLSVNTGGDSAANVFHFLRSFPRLENSLLWGAWWEVELASQMLTVVA